MTECKMPAGFEIYPHLAENPEDVTYACAEHVGEFLPDGWAHIRPHPDVPGELAGKCCYVDDDFDRLEFLAAAADNRFNQMTHEILGVLRALANGDKGLALELIGQIPDRIAIESSGELGS